MDDYFYGQQAELFSFYRVPKVLFTDEKFSNISSDAKLLYGIMLDRMNLSAKNGWVDELGRVYIIFTIEEVKGALGCAEKKAVKLLHELENKCGLIERKRIGLFKIHQRCYSIKLKEYMVIVVRLNLSIKSTML